MGCRKIYKELQTINNSNLRVVSMIPGDQNVLPDDLILKQKHYKLAKIINNIQIPGMAPRSNAGLPIFSFSILNIILDVKHEKCSSIC